MYDRTSLETFGLLMSSPSIKIEAALYWGALLTHLWRCLCMGLPHTSLVTCNLQKDWQESPMVKRIVWPLKWLQIPRFEFSNTHSFGLDQSLKLGSHGIIECTNVGPVSNLCLDHAERCNCWTFFFLATSHVVARWMAKWPIHLSLRVISLWCLGVTLSFNYLYTCNRCKQNMINNWYFITMLVLSHLGFMLLCCTGKSTIFLLCFMWFQNGSLLISISSII